MVNLNNVNAEQVDDMKAAAAARFAPLLLQEALRRLCQAGGPEWLDRFEKIMVDRIDQFRDETPRLDLMKEFAIEQLYGILREVRCSPDMKKPLEKIEERRTQGRSEHPATLEEQLQIGLEESFPASDPPAVVSTSITGGAEKIIGTDEMLRRRREQEKRHEAEAGAA